MVQNLDEAGCSLDDFALEPFILRYDPSRSYRAMIRDLLDQVQEHEAENPGIACKDTVLRYLIGAELELMLAGKHKTITYPSRSVDDASRLGAGDFLIEQAAIHVTTSPSLRLMEICKENLATGLKPIIVTLDDQVETAGILVQRKNMASRIEIFAAEQFLAAGFYRLSEFGEIERNTTVERLVAVYNRLIDKYENDPSLRIRIGK